MSAIPARFGAISHGSLKVAPIAGWMVVGVWFESRKGSQGQSGYVVLINCLGPDTSPSCRSFEDSASHHVFKVSVPTHPEMQCSPESLQSAASPASVTSSLGIQTVVHGTQAPLPSHQPSPIDSIHAQSERSHRLSQDRALILEELGNLSRELAVLEAELGLPFNPESRITLESLWQDPGGEAAWAGSLFTEASMLPP